MTGRIETYATPYRLYRFRKIIDETNGEDRLKREIEAIKGRYVFCPSFDEMNDPMEGSHRVSAALQRRIDKRQPNLIEEVGSAMKEIGIASFSEVSLHEPMWAHYANNFAGICVEYSLYTLLDEVSDDHAFIRMIYSEDAPVLRAGRKSVDLMARVVLSQKTARWMSEREWRLVSPSRGPVKYKSKRAVTRVILGARISDVHETFVRTELGKINVQVEKMSLKPYEMKFVPLPRKTVGVLPVRRKARSGQN